MRTQLFGVMTGVALLASTGLASAGQRVTLTDAQLDGVVAGLAQVNAFGTQVNASLTFFLFDEQSIPFSDAAIAGSFTPNGPNPLLSLSASASVGR